MNKTALGAALAMGILLAAALWRHPAGPAPAMPAIAGPAATTPAWRAPPAPAVTVHAVPERSLADQVDALVATRDPAQTYAAYRLLRDCATFNRDGDRLTFDQEEFRHRSADAMPGFRGMTAQEKSHDAVFCASMTERMRQSRIDYLAFAAQNGIAGAILEQIEQGPFGDRSALVTRPDDPLVREWKARVQAQLARSAEQDADPGVLNYLSVMHMIGNEVVEQDAALSYRYGIAYGMILSDLNPAGNMAALYGPDGGMVRDAAAQLTSQERAIQVVEARRIADAARARRQQP